MKKNLYAIIITLLITCITTPSITAQEFTKWGLPEGATARFGKGTTWGDFAYSPDGSKFALPNQIGIWIYDAETGEELDLYTGHTDRVGSVAFSPDGNTLASGSSDRTVRLWDANTGEHLQTLERHQGGIGSVAFSPDGNTLASGSSDKTVQLWNANTGENLRTLEGHQGGIGSVAFSPDGNTLASGSSDKTVRFWNTNTGEHLKTFDVLSSDISFSPDWTMIASISYDLDVSLPIVIGPTGTHQRPPDRVIHLWDITTGEHLRTLEVPRGSISSIVFHPKNNILVGGSWDGIHLWNANTGEHLQTLEGHTTWVDYLSFSPDGNTLISESRDSTIYVWDVNSGNPKRSIEGHAISYSSVAFSPDGSILAGGVYEGGIRLWDIKTGEELKTLTGTGGRVYELSYSPDGDMIASVGPDQGAIFLLDVNTTNVIRRMRSGYCKWLECVSFSPDGKLVACGGAGSFEADISIWEVRTGKLHLRISERTGYVESVAFSPDSKMLAYGGTDDIIRLWDVDAGELLRMYEGHTANIRSIAFSPDGNTLVSGSGHYADGDNTVRLWNVKSGELLHTLEQHTDIVNSVAFSPDGNVIASGSDDDTIKLWDANKGTHLRKLEGHTGPVRSISFSSDNHTLVSGSSDGTVLIWDYRSDAANVDEPFSVEARDKKLVTFGQIKRNRLFQNYPNPFNPETWIPYQLASPAHVRISIWTEDGKLIRTLDLGNKLSGIYQDHDRAAFWDGKNKNGEKIASGVYFYTLTADDFTATRKMLIRK